MILNVSAHLRGVSQKLKPTKPWCWLVKLTLDEQPDPDPTTVLCITDAEEAIAFPVDGVPTTFYPFPLSFGDLELDAEGNLPALSLSVSNVTRELGPYLEAGLGFLDQKVRLWLVNREFLSDYHDSISFDLQVAAAALNNEALTLDLRVSQLYERRIPQENVQAWGCTALYKDGRTCPYRGALVSCRHNLEDCVLHGDDMVAHGYPRVLPMRIRGFPAATEVPG